MKDAPNTTPPIVGRQKTAGGLRRMLLGHADADMYYEALDAAGRWYLWMEFSRFGRLRAYPCAVREEGAVLAFRPYGDNAAFLARWEALLTPENLRTLQITELNKADFQRIYRAHRAEDETPDDPQT